MTDPSELERLRVQVVNLQGDRDEAVRMLRLVLPMARAWAHQCDVGANKANADRASHFLANAEVE